MSCVWCSVQSYTSWKGKKSLDRNGKESGDITKNKSRGGRDQFLSQVKEALALSYFCIVVLALIGSFFKKLAGH